MDLPASGNEPLLKNRLSDCSRDLLSLSLSPSFSASSGYLTEGRRESNIS